MDASDILREICLNNTSAGDDVRNYTWWVDNASQKEVYMMLKEAKARSFAIRFDDARRQLYMSVKSPWITTLDGHMDVQSNVGHFRINRDDKNKKYSVVDGVTFATIASLVKHYQSHLYCTMIEAKLKSGKVMRYSTVFMLSEDYSLKSDRTSHVGHECILGQLEKGLSKDVTSRLPLDLLLSYSLDISAGSIVKVWAVAKTLPDFYIVQLVGTDIVLGVPQSWVTGYLDDQKWYFGNRSGQEMKALLADKECGTYGVTRTSSTSRKTGRSTVTYNVYTRCDPKLHGRDYAKLKAKYMKVDQVEGHRFWVQGYRGKNDSDPSQGSFRTVQSMLHQLTIVGYPGTLSKIVPTTPARKVPKTAAIAEQ